MQQIVDIRCLLSKIIDSPKGDGNFVTIFGTPISLR